jgi:hypothetical protein
MTKRESELPLSSITESSSMLQATAWLLPTSVVISFQTRAEILGALHHVLGLPSMCLHNEAALFRAVQWFEQGVDFCDSLHLALSPSTATRVIFDKDFVKRAGCMEAFPAVALCPD